MSDRRPATRLPAAVVVPRSRRLEALRSVGLTVLLTGLQACLAWRLLVPEVPPGPTRALLCLLSLLAVVVGLALWQPVDRPAPSSSRWLERQTATALHLALPLSGVVGLLMLVGLVGSGGLVPPSVAGALWGCLGLATVALVSAWRAPLRGAVPSWFQLLLPGVLLLAVLVWVLVVADPASGVVLAQDVGTGLGFVSLVVVPATAVSEAVGGAETHRDRALRVHRVTAHRPATAPVLLALKLLVVLGVAWAAARLRPGWDYLLSSPRIWGVAGLLALVVLSVLVVERRLGITAEDHRSLVRGPSLVFAAAMAAVVGLAVVAVVVALLGSSPFASACLVTLLAGWAALVRWVPAALRRWSYPVAFLTGVLGSIAVRGQPAPRLTSAMGWFTHLWLVVAAAVLGTLVGAVLLVVRSDRGRRRRLLLFSLALLLWLGLTVAARSVAPSWSWLNLDLAIGVVLLVAWITWRLGWQDRIDGFEVVVAAVATSLVLDGAVLVDSLGAQLTSVVLALTLVGPGAWRTFRLWRPAPGTDLRSRSRDVGRSCTLYGLLLALVGVTGAASAQTLDSLTTLVAQLLLLPLAMLLLSAASAARPPPEPAASNPVPP